MFFIVALLSPIMYDTPKDVHLMFKKKHYLYLDESEYNVLVRSLVELKNRLIRAERFTDCVDELIMKVLSAPVKRI